MASKPTVAQVVAPSNLEEGYVLDVVLDGKTCGVIVPPGGVKEGESFQGEVVHDVKTAKASSDDVVHFIPEGKWRDDCCDCCSLGCCHPLFWLTWCCPWCKYKIYGDQRVTRNKATAVCAVTLESMPPF